MLFLFGEKIIASTEDLGSFDCPICESSKQLVKVIEKNYFTVFFIRTLPMDTVAEYSQCLSCGHAFPSNDQSEPTYFEPLKSVLAYLLVGFGLTNKLETARKVYLSITGKETSSSDLQQKINEIHHNGQMLSYFKEASKKLSWLDKSLIIEAAYLLLYASSPIEYEERLRINLLANDMGIGIEGVNAIIKNLQTQQYKGFQPA